MPNPELFAGEEGGSDGIQKDTERVKTREVKLEMTEEEWTRILLLPELLAHLVYYQIIQELKLGDVSMTRIRELVRPRRIELPSGAIELAKRPREGFVIEKINRFLSAQKVPYKIFPTVHHQKRQKGKSTEYKMFHIIER